MAIRLNLTPRADDAALPAATPSGSRVGRWLERLLLMIGVVCLVSYAFARTEAYLYQQMENRELDAILAGAVPPAAVPEDGRVAPPRVQPANGSLLGRIEIPRLGVSAIVRAGADARTLQLAVGHIPGTALPGEPGNVGLAGHRDTFFRKLRDIRSDDLIRVITPEGVFAYRVERTDVVNPDDVWVLQATDRSVLTLVTCFPFTYVGSAPQRFIVRAAAA